MSACAICHRSTDPGLHACPRHTAELRAWLAELPHQAELLEEFLTPAARPAAGRIGGTGRAHSPAPADLRALALLGPGHADTHGPDDDGTIPIRALLDAWAGYIAYTYPAVHRDPHGTQHTAPCQQALPRHGATITGWCTWLTAYLPYALTHPWIGDLHRQLHDLTARIHDLTHTTPREHHMDAPCPACGTFRLVTAGEDITCHACGHHLTRTEYDDHTKHVLQAHTAAVAGGTAA